jgi:hypothetical protein
MIARMPCPVTWHIFQIIINVFSPIVFTYVLDQSKGHWLLSDVLNFAISIWLKLKKEIRILVFFIILWKRSPFLFLNYVFWPLTLKNIMVLYLFYFILIFFETWKKIHNMLLLMLNLRFKNLCLMSSFIGLEQGKVIIE